MYTERDGYDSHDSYSYVAGNPVNFRDPSGEKWTWDALAKPVRIAVENANNSMKIMGTNIGNGARWAASGMSGTVRTLGTNIGNGAKWAAAGMSGTVRTLGTNIGNGAKWAAAGMSGMVRAMGTDIGNGARWAAKNGTREEALYFFAFFTGSGMSVQEFLFMYFASRTLNTHEAWFGHNYTGPAGNVDPYADYHEDFNNFVIKMFVIAYFLNDSGQTNITPNELASFIAIVPLLSPKPKSFADKLSMRHDREWKNGNISKIFDANNHFVTGFVKGIFTKEFWEKPVDSIVVGGGGALTLGCLNYCIFFAF